MWKNEKFSLSEKKFRQIKYLVIPLVKPLISRNFCEQSVIAAILSHIIEWQKFRESNVFTK